MSSANDMNGTPLAIGDEVQVTHDTNIPLRAGEMVTVEEVRGKRFTIGRNLHTSDGLADHDGELRLDPKDSEAMRDVFTYREYVLPSAVTKVDPTIEAAEDGTPLSAGALAADVVRLNGELAEAKRELEQARTARDNARSELRGLGRAEGLVRALERHTESDDVNVEKGSDVGFEDDGDCVVVVLKGVTLDNDGDIVTLVREYEYEATITLTVTVRGTVEARDDDEAHDLAYDAANELDLRVESYGDGEVEYHDTDNVDIDSVTDMS